MRMIWWIPMFLMGVSAFANSDRSGYLLKTELSYEAGSQKVDTSSVVVLAAANNAWTQLSASKEGVLLLGRLVDLKGKNIHMEYLLLDTRRENKVVSTPAIIATLGQKATFEARDGKEKVTVSLTATKKTIQ